MYVILGTQISIIYYLQMHTVSGRNRILDTPKWREWFSLGVDGLSLGRVKRLRGRYTWDFNYTCSVLMSLKDNGKQIFKNYHP